MLSRLSTSAVRTMPIVSAPWALREWPPVFWQANSRRRPRFVHLATRVTSGRDRRQPCAGHTVWGDVSGGSDTGMAWDWIEIAWGVVAMVDPMGVTTNMQLVNREGIVLPASEAALHINQFVRRLPWQEEVNRLLKAP